MKNSLMDLLIVWIKRAVLFGVMLMPLGAQEEEVEVTGRIFWMKPQRAKIFSKGETIKDERTERKLYYFSNKKLEHISIKHNEYSGEFTMEAEVNWGFYFKPPVVEKGQELPKPDVILPLVNESGKYVFVLNSSEKNYHFISFPAQVEPAQRNSLIVYNFSDQQIYFDTSAGKMSIAAKSKKTIKMSAPEEGKRGNFLMNAYLKKKRDNGSVIPYKIFSRYYKFQAGSKGLAVISQLDDRYKMNILPEVLFEKK